MKKYLCWLFVVTVMVGNCFQSYAQVESWSINSGLWPSQTSQNWTYHGDTISLRPGVNEEYMLVETIQNRKVSYFESTPNCLTIPKNLTIEFRARMWKRNSCYDNASSAAVYFGLGAGLGSTLYLGIDDVWLAGANQTRSAGSAVDTDNTFHTYRIELSGKTVGSVINVYYDDSVSPLLTSTVFFDSEANGNSERIGFGDILREDSGSSKWSYLWHNAQCMPVEIVPEPTIGALVIAGGAMLIARRNRKTQS